MDYGLFDTLLDGIVVVDQKGVVVYCNDAINLITNPATPKFRKGAVLQKIFQSEGFEFPFLNASTHSREDYQQYKEFEYKGDDGEVTHLLVSMKPETREGKQTGNWVYYFRDVTVEEALDLKYKKALEKKEQAFRELQETQDQLIQTSKTAVIGQFVASVTHELNNPLSYVISAVQEMDTALRRKDVDLKSIQKLIALAQEGSVRIMEMSNRLRSFLHSPLEAKRFSLANIDDAIQKAVEFTVHYTRLQNVKVIHQLNQDLPLTLIDISSIEQVAINLIRNATDALAAMPSGHSKVIEIKGRFHQKSQAIIISFRDSGPGIPVETRRKLFRPFFTTKEVGKGTGLGLNICASIAERHGGTLTAASFDGPGATFYLTLPVRKKLLNPEPVDPKVNLQGVRVMLVDDEPWIRLLEKSALDKLGCNVVEADSGIDALKMCETEPPQVIMTDYSMEGMTGLEFAQTVRKLYPGVRIILVTGSIVMQSHNLEIGLFDECISKPFPKDSISAAVKKVLSV